MKKSLVIDGQVFQTPAWDRGMGKYSLEFIHALCLVNDDKKYWTSIEIVLSKRVKDNKKLQHTLRQSLGKKVNIFLLDLHLNEYDNRLVVGKNRYILDNFIKEQTSINGLERVDMLVLSLMQSEIAPAFSSLPYVNNVLLFYDLIPLMLHKTYLVDALNSKVYLSKLAELFHADAYLTISKTVANDLALYTGIHPSRIHNIDGGPVNHADNPEQLSIRKPYILMPTGNDHRKNNKRAILGFEAFNKKHDHKFQLVITSSFKDHEIAQLKKLSKNVVFTGNISGGQLDHLFENMDILLFPSEYEGLGLPILEAAEKYKPIACSNISVFREISQAAFHYFDPTSIPGITDALNIAVAAEVPKNEYKEILRKYSWQKTAKEAAKVFSGLDKALVNKESINIFTQDPSLATLAAKFSQTVHAEMSRNFHINYHVQNSTEHGDSKQRVNYLDNVTEMKDDSDSLNIYNIDKTQYSSHALFAGLAIPGLAILHTLDIRASWDDLFKKGLIDTTRLDLESELQQEFGSRGTSHLVSFVANQHAIVVFDDNTYDAVKRILTNTGSRAKLQKLNYPVPELVYSDILSETRSSTTKVSLLIDGRTDFEVHTLLDKALFIVDDVVNSKEDIQPLLIEAMACGVIPKTNEGYYISAMQGGSPLTSKHPRKVQEILKYIQANHGLRDYVTNITDIMTNIRNDEEAKDNEKSLH